MARWLVGLGGLLCGSALCLGAEPPRVVTMFVTIASGSDARLGLTHDPQALAKAVAELEASNGLSHIARIKFSAIEEQQSHVQFGESVSVIAGRTFGFGGSRGSAPSGAGGTGGPASAPREGGPTSVPMFQQQQTGTMVLATARVVESGVLAEFSVEQTRLDKSRPAAEDPQSAPPSKPILMVKSSVTIPRDGTVLLGGFERTADGATERTVVLVSATASGPPAGAAALNQQRLKIFSLHNGDGEAMREVLEDLFPKRDYSAAVDKRTNSLLIQSDEETLKVMEAIILRFEESDIRRPPSDPPAAARVEKEQILHLFSLKRLDVTAVQKTLETLLPNQPVRIAIDAQSHSLAVLADQDTLTEIKRLILQLDEPQKPGEPTSARPLESRKRIPTIPNLIEQQVDPAR